MNCSPSIWTPLIRVPVGGPPTAVGTGTPARLLPRGNSLRCLKWRFTLPMVTVTENDETYVSSLSSSCRCCRLSLKRRWAPRWTWSVDRRCGAGSATTPTAPAMASAPTSASTRDPSGCRDDSRRPSQTWASPNHQSRLAW